MVQFDTVKSASRSSSGATAYLVPVRRPSDEVAQSMTSRPSLSDDIAAVELPQWLDHPSSGAPASEREKLEDDPSLDLPLPIAPRPAPFIRLRLWNREFLVMSDLQAIRTVKSTLLVAKVRDQIRFDRS